MTNLKTKEEMYFDYNEAIEQLENEVSGLKSLIGRTEVEIKHKNDRIEKLKETAEMYAPKVDVSTHITIDTKGFADEAFIRAVKQMSESLLNSRIK